MFQSMTTITLDDHRRDFSNRFVGDTSQSAQHPVPLTFGTHTRSPPALSRFGRFSRVAAEQIGAKA